ncbi:hypothetical protein GCM10010402_40410 [Actinomadura luteofluorescens]|uniref:hypothetical protein n=1 Tax=Actinomadura luteofluorescens TaxID=46163 RepID=UPI002164A2FA|nr:hypothetical protein [Actinomadura glauciflava]MCR3745205.1 hypothetical protein [Actinomadura glauciflava]
MERGRAVLIVTCGVVVVLAVVLGALSWEQANKIATSASALAGVAAVGVGVWAAYAGSARRGVRVADSGRAVSGPGGSAVSGVRAPAGQGPGDVAVERTGDADASAGGDAVSGADLTDD